MIKYYLGKVLTLLDGRLVRASVRQDESIVRHHLFDVYLGTFKF